mmetsp:Transcript_39213/g.65104  ORF Transcript_39213/g.65104 Transcript_39213/m.65104 type:complete len:245 (+) Transcript_39213:1394-2128(+)
MHSKHLHAERMKLIECPHAVQGGGDWAVRLFSQLLQLVRAVQTPVASDDDGPLGPIEQVHNGINITFVSGTAQVGFISRGHELGNVITLDRVRNNILGQIDDHGTLFAVLGNKECLVNNGREFIYVLELVCPLGAWPCQFNSGALLKSTRTHSGCRNLACESNHRDGVIQRILKWSNQIGRAWSRGGHDHAGFARGFGVTLCYVPCTLLVCSLDKLHTTSIQPVQGRQNGTSRIAEDMLHTMLH